MISLFRSPARWTPFSACSVPSSTFHLSAGNPVLVKARQPAPVLPSNRSCQPADFSAAVKVLGVSAAAARAGPPATTAAKKQPARREEVFMVGCGEKQ